MIKRLLLLSLLGLLLVGLLGCAAAEGQGTSRTRRQPGNLPYWAQPIQYDEWGHPGVDPWEP